MKEIIKNVPTIREYGMYGNYGELTPLEITGRFSDGTTVVKMLIDDKNTIELVFDNDIIDFDSFKRV